jgi:hypothetical protein
LPPHLVFAERSRGPAEREQPPRALYLPELLTENLADVLGEVAREPLALGMGETCYRPLIISPSPRSGVHVRNNNRDRRPPLLRLKAVCGPGDDAEPVVTVMKPGED